jgi:hypothetical protein
MRMRSIVLLGGLLFAAPSQAHETGLSYLRLHVDGASVAIEIDLGLGDAARSIGLPFVRPPDVDPQPARERLWAQIAERGAALVERVRPAVAIWQDGAPCPIESAEPLGRAPETGFARMHYTARCPAAGTTTIGLAWTLPFELDPAHRALVKVQSGDAIQSVILSSTQQRVELPLGRPTPGLDFWSYLVEGVHHILSGPDHLLFLMALLLPAPLVWTTDGYRARPGVTAVVVEILQTVTAFTVAHSVTLALSVLGAVALPARFVESAIAASVALAALNGIRPFLRGRPWQIAFTFGLVHGLGFARFLLELGLPTVSRLTALLAFNLGVEIGQLAVVAAALPLLLVLGRRAFYRRWLLPSACTVIAGIAAIWLVERLAGVQLFAQSWTIRRG